MSPCPFTHGPGPLQRDDITPYNKQLNLNRALTEKRGGFGDGAECGSALDPVEETSTTATTGFKLVFSREAGGEEYSHLAVDVVNGHTVAYVGTASGKVLAVFLAKVPGPRDEDGLTVIGEAQTRTIWTATSSITGLSLAPERGLLFALTAGAMQAVELSRCSNFTTCGDCAAAKWVSPRRLPPAGCLLPFAGCPQPAASPPAALHKLSTSWSPTRKPLPAQSPSHMPCFALRRAPPLPPRQSSRRPHL